jgi:hypothetical protein
MAGRSRSNGAATRGHSAIKFQSARPTIHSMKARSASLATKSGALRGALRASGRHALNTQHAADLMLSWRESSVLRGLGLRYDLGDVSRSTLACTSILSTMLQLMRC